MRFTATEIEHAQRIVHAAMPPTPQYVWPLLAERLDCTVWVKHENHTPAGAFKVRGGLTYFDALTRREPAVRGVVAATRGNHGQSVARAAKAHGLAATIVVPRGNSIEKNAAMRGFGATLVEHGEDFQEAREQALHLAGERDWHMVGSFARELVLGVATYWIEFFEHTMRAGAEPAVVFVPIGQGSGFCAAAAARAYTGARSKLVGVVSAHATTYLESFRAGCVVESPVTTVLADGMACRVADTDALAIVRAEADDIVAVTDDEVAGAMRALFADTHNVAEGAGAASLAAAMQQRDRLRGQVVGTTLCGGNIDGDVFARVLAGGDGSVRAQDA